VDTSVTKVGTKEQNPALYATANEQINAYENCVRVFTDASKTESGQTAAAYCIPELDIEYSCRLSDDVTIFSGELSAIKLSLLWVKHNYEKYDLKRDIAFSVILFLRYQQ